MTYPWLTFHTTPEDQLVLIDGERRWEIEGIQRGVERVRKMVADANHKAVKSGTGGLADLDAGAVILHDVIKPFIPAIKELQEEALNGFGRRGPIGRWWLPMLSLEPEKWAVITVRSVLAGLAPGLRDNRLTTPLAIQIASHGKLQREFDLWRKAEGKAWKDSPNSHVDLYRVMISRVKKVTPRSAQKWMKLSRLADKLEWTKEDKVHVGLRLLDALVRVGGGWFEMVLVGRGGGRTRVTERQLVMTDIAKEWIKDHNVQTELQRPFLAPMLTPPDPWRWEEPRREEPEHPAIPAEDREGSNQVQPEGQA